MVKLLNLSMVAVGLGGPRYLVRNGVIEKPAILLPAFENRRTSLPSRTTRPQLAVVFDLVDPVRAGRNDLQVGMQNSTCFMDDHLCTAGKKARVGERREPAAVLPCSRVRHADLTLRSMSAVSLSPTHAARRRLICLRPIWVGVARRRESRRRRPALLQRCIAAIDGGGAALPPLLEADQ